MILMNREILNLQDIKVKEVKKNMNSLLLVGSEKG